MSEMLPNYMKIKKFIIQNIQSGNWKPGYKVPSENELGKLFNVSRMTVNKALRELTSEGMILRIQGKGTFVAEENNVSEMLEIKGVVNEVERLGKKHHLEVIKKEKIKANKELIRWMGLKENEELFHVLLLHFADSEPFQLEDRFVNKNIVPDFLNVDFNNETAHRYLMRTTPLTEAEHIVESVLANKEQVKLLQITETTPCLQLKRRTWLNNEVVTYVKFISSGKKYKIGTRFKYSNTGVAMRKTV